LQFQKQTTGTLNFEMTDDKGFCEIACNTKNLARRQNQEKSAAQNVYARPAHAQLMELSSN